MTDSSILELAKVAQSGRRALLATVIRASGPSYRKPGASAVVAEDGEIIGAISGGCLEADLLVAAEEILRGAPPRVLEYDTSSEEDLIWGTSSGCGGRVQILLAPVPAELVSAAQAELRAGRAVVLHTCIAPGPDLGRRTLGGATARTEPYWYSDGETICHQLLAPPVTMLLCGAGNDAQPVAKLAAAATFRVAVVDHRASWATAERFPDAQAVIVCQPEELDAHLPIPAGSYAVLMTHHYHKDLAYLKMLLEQPVAYVGLLGARERSRALVRQLLRERPDLGEAARTRLRAPVGLEIGADGPFEIALSIVAELVAERAGMQKQAGGKSLAQ
ncbi:MAG: pucA [Firmicutes bacterium]|nr:pucA [Bacillota bacterium]